MSSSVRRFIVGACTPFAYVGLALIPLLAFPPLFFDLPTPSYLLLEPEGLSTHLRRRPRSCRFLADLLCSVLGIVSVSITREQKFLFFRLFLTILGVLSR